MSTVIPEQQSTQEEHSVLVYVHWEHDHWSAVLPDFTLVGRGDTVEAAVVNAADALAGYLELCSEEGRSFEEAKRPVPWRWRTEMRVRVLASRIAKHLGERRPRFSIGAQEVHMDSAGHLLHC